MCLEGSEIFLARRLDWMIVLGSMDETGAVVTMDASIPYRAAVDYTWFEG